MVFCPFAFFPVLDTFPCRRHPFSDYPMNGLSWLHSLFASYRPLPSSGAFRSHSKTSVVLINQVVWCHQPPSINLLVISFLGSLMNILNNTVSSPKSLEPSSPRPPQCLSPCQELLDIHTFALSFGTSLKFINMNLLSSVGEESLGMCVGVEMHMHVLERERLGRGSLRETDIKRTTGKDNEKFSITGFLSTGFLKISQLHIMHILYTLILNLLSVVSLCHPPQTMNHSLIKRHKWKGP